MNSMNIKYLINENDEGINLFGKEFVNNNKENCILTFNNKDYELCNYIKFEVIIMASFMYSYNF